MHSDVGGSAPVKTTCAYCGVGCGVEVTRKLDGSVDVRGDAQHPANFGRLCSKGSLLGDTVGNEQRLLYPMIHGERVAWSEALDTVADGFKKVIATDGPEAVALYVSGQMLTEDYYVANKLMKGFIGAANIDTNSRLCMASSVVAHSRAFGFDTVPGCYEDLELADLIVITGSNMAWCHPVLWQRIQDAKKSRNKPQIVVIDPRKTETAEKADLHLPIRSGTDSVLFNGLLHYLRQNDKLDFGFLENSATGFSEALEKAKHFPIVEVARLCSLEESKIARFFGMFSRTEKVVTTFAQGIHQSSSGTDKINSIINVHLATGRISKPGAGPFSLTGQINAMGGREVGGIATTLAGHLGFQNPRHAEILKTFWRAPAIAPRPGLKAVELFQAIHSGKVKAVWIIATNPVVSLPDADLVREALQKCELVVLSECFKTTDTAKLAHVLLSLRPRGAKKWVR